MIWNRSERREIEAMLKSGLDEARLRLARAEISRLSREFGDWPDKTGGLARQLVGFLSQRCAEQEQDIYALRRRHAEFRRRYGRAYDVAEQRLHILDFARDLGASEQELKADQQAFSRDFDIDAIDDRYARLHGADERRLAIMLERLGALAQLELSHAKEAGPRRWQALRIEPVIRGLLAYDGDPRVRQAAFHALSNALRGLPDEHQQGVVSNATLQYIYRSALEPRQDVWTQCEALGLLKTLSSEGLATALRKRLAEPRDGDDLFVRRHAVRLWGESLQRLPDLGSLAEKILVDPSPHVRQAMAPALLGADNSLLLPSLRRLLCDDSEPVVRAATSQILPELCVREERQQLGDLLDQALSSEQDALVLRALLRALVIAARGWPEAERTDWCRARLPALNKLRTGCPNLAVRRWAAETAEDLWLIGEPQLLFVADQWRALIAPLREGQSAWVPRHLLKGMDINCLGRLLAVLGREGFGLELEQGLLGARLRHGARRQFRLWRLWHEWRHPSPDKRQAYRHTVGRVYRGLIQAPGARLAELAETKVPGEPLMMGQEDGWRPYLPLPDQVISSLDQGWPTRPLCIFTAEGKTELLPPASLLRRLLARLRLTFGFQHYAALRNWREGEQATPAQYLEALMGLGFKVRFSPAGARQVCGDGESQAVTDPAVARFFPAVLPFSPGELWQRTQDYFFSVYENTLPQLAMFLALMSSWFFGRHLYVNQRLAAARRRLPLVIGGWGTRGKSGTERLKAALFNALGYRVVSKTSGCEAMFLLSHPYGELRELFLFRPYDKATIWEQYDLVRHADGLGCEVFLWECMALTPSYVYLLQRHWMRDDISTLTNTYPDHEDLQGPAGADIPQVMTQFIPRRSRLVTSEEQMLPILRDGARRVGTSLVSVGWLEAGLLAPDVLSRFPYDEHPYNIALVLAMAGELGIEPDFALKEMADRVVPDLGVLKTYPTADVDGRRLQFVMGMSANERFGALGNWRRTGFDRHSLERDPEVWVTALVNNRADRIARSRVFASLLVEEISADRIVLIGSNLSGLVGYIREAWAELESGLTLFPGNQQGAETILTQQAQRLRVPVTQAQVQRRLQAMLRGLGVEQAATPLQPDSPQWSGLLETVDEQLREALLAQYRADLSSFEAYQSLLTMLQQEQDVSILDTRFQQQCRQWFESRLVVVEDYYATGEQVIAEIVRNTPPGLLNRIMGMQNIKGTGLDYVYRWLAWEQCASICRQVRQPLESEAREGLRRLVAFQEFGQLSEQRVAETLDWCAAQPWAQREEQQAEIQRIREHLAGQLEKIRAELGTVRGEGGWRDRMLTVLEAFLDAGDAVRRRRRADQIYRDIAAGRIGLDNAARQLQELTKRQKGGWLLKKLRLQ